MIKLYTNEHIALRCTVALRFLGYDVLTTKEAGLVSRGVPDVEVLRYAAGLERAVVTLNRSHFWRLHKAGHSHHGIILCTRNDDWETLARRIHEAIGGAAQPSAPKGQRHARRRLRPRERSTGEATGLGIRLHAAMRASASADPALGRLGI
jgi:hypothetical protein